MDNRELVWCFRQSDVAVDIEFDIDTRKARQTYRRRLLSRNCIDPNKATRPCCNFLGLADPIHGNFAEGRSYTFRRHLFQQISRNQTWRYAVHQDSCLKPEKISGHGIDAKWRSTSREKCHRTLAATPRTSRTR